MAPQQAINEFANPHNRKRPPNRPAKCAYAETGNRPTSGPANRAHPGKNLVHSQCLAGNPILRSAPWPPAKII